jgi:hypothetical protein
MAKIFHLKRLTTATLRARKQALFVRLAIPGNSVRASYVTQTVTCGKSNCRCNRGRRHGPFHYVVQCLHTGKVRKYLLKSAGQKEQARAAISAYIEFQEKLEELSQINAELLRRGEDLNEQTSAHSRLR